MAITKFTIDTHEYTSYASLDEANEFLRPDARWTVWNAIADDVDKEIRLIQATREIDRAGVYTGTKTQETQDTEFPRMGLRKNGVPVSQQLPDDIVHACILLAGTIATNPSSISPATTTATRSISSIAAGSVEIEYSTGAAAVQTEDTLAVPDDTADALIRQYFKAAGSTGVISSLSSGTDRETEFDRRKDAEYFIY